MRSLKQATTAIAPNTGMQTDTVKRSPTARGLNPQVVARADARRVVSSQVP